MPSVLRPGIQNDAAAVVDSTVCGEYFCLFTLYLGLWYTPKDFVDLFDAAITDRQISHLCTSDLGPLLATRRGVQVCTPTRL